MHHGPIENDDPLHLSWAALTFLPCQRVGAEPAGVSSVLFGCFESERRQRVERLGRHDDMILSIVDELGRNAMVSRKAAM
jgi:hypothetical protein